MDKLRAWLCLKSAPGIKSRALLELARKYPDPTEYVGNPAHAVFGDSALPEEALAHLAEARPHPRQEQIVRLCAHYGIDLICFGEPDYPQGLAEIVSPPLILWYRGDLKSALAKTCFAVVGTRKPTSYGRESCAKLLAPACRQGVTVISGLAAGIDTCAHNAALSGYANTIAVLASGVDTIYPASNHDLAARIVSQGALVSEYEPGTKIDAWNFPARNRIISGLANAVFVVEGSLSSGALLTAKFALEQGRDICALPGDINHQNAQGPNYLIKNGAYCITCPEDILSLLGLDAELKDQMEILPDISPEEQAVYDFFREEQREICFDELIVSTGHSFGKLSTILLNLELKGFLARSGGNSYTLA